MRVDVGSRGNVAVAQPFLDLFQADAVGIQQARATVPLRYNNDKPENPAISMVRTV